MTTIYNSLKNNFTQVSNLALLDTRLSSKAYKLYAYMCFRIGISESWKFNKDEILNHFKEGDRAMRSAFSELIKAGFLERKRIRNDKGFFEGTDYIIYAEPVNTGSNPQGQNARVDNAHVDNPHVDNAVYNNKEGNNKEGNNKDLSLENVERILRENNFKNVNAEKIYNWLSKEKVLRNSVENIVIKLAEKPENQLKEVAKGESKEVTAIRKAIKRALLDEPYRYLDWFATAPVNSKTATIYVKSKQALRYADLLGKIRIKIKLEKDLV